MKRKEMIEYLAGLRAGKRTIDELLVKKEFKTKTITLIESRETPGYFPGEKEHTVDYLSGEEKKENVVWSFHIMRILCPHHDKTN